MKFFVRDVLSEEGRPSSKRVAFFILLFAFLAEISYNMKTGKEPSPVLRDQLYLMLTTSLGVIFGANILNIIKDIKVTQSNNNAQVGSPSPTPDPAPAPSPAAVTNVIQP